MIELSTLTGAVVIALGSTAGIWSNNEALVNDLRKVGSEVGDAVWHMPVTEEAQELVIPKSADLTNSPGKPNGSSNQAAAFLEVDDF